MKRKLLFFVFIIIGLLGKAQNKFGLSHGPYLQEVTNNGATFVFLTSNNSFSSVELKHIDSNESKLYHHTQHGLKDAYDTFYAIRVEQLQSGVTYQYRIHSKEIRSFEPYKVVYGDSITTQWYTFKTVDLKSKGGSIFITSDTHDDAKRLEKFLELCDYKTCDAFFYGGDVMSYIPTKETPFSSFIDSSVKMFATSSPFELVRGNHETRGKLARFFPELFPKKDGKIYGSYLLGDIMVVMLDCGEDKSDQHSVYAGLTDFDSYRTEQAEWLKKLVKTKEYRKAKYRIVISHFPLVVDERFKLEKIWEGWYDASAKFLPILNKAKVDLLVSGHTHRFLYHDISKSNNFPILEQGAICATRLDIANGRIKIKVIDYEGKVLLERTL